MSLVYSILIVSLALLALFLAYRRRRSRRLLTPSSRMRLSEREVAELARQSVQRFLQDTDDVAA